MTDRDKLSTNRNDQCWCAECEDVRLAPLPFLDQLTGRRFIVCPDCGNKRCPKAHQHDRPCTNSNKPNQPGGG